MNKKILIIGDSEMAPYHPLESISILKDLLKDYDLTFTDDRRYFLRINEFYMCICYLDSWEHPLCHSHSIALKEYLFNGGKLVNIHNGISLQETQDWIEILGAKFTHHPPIGELYINLNSNHSLTKGVKSFKIYDEPYHFEVSGELNVFATYDYMGTALPAAWESFYGKGTLIYLMPGHDKTAFECEEYCKLILNCIDLK